MGLNKFCDTNSLVKGLEKPDSILLFTSYLLIVSHIYQVYFMCSTTSNVLYFICLLFTLPTSWMNYYITHECVHHNVCYLYKYNYVIGCILSCPSYIVFDAYRWVHIKHHNSQGTEFDPYLKYSNHSMYDHVVKTIKMCQYGYTMPWKNVGCILLYTILMFCTAGLYITFQIFVMYVIGYHTSNMSHLPNYPQVLSGLSVQDWFPFAKPMSKNILYLHFRNPNISVTNLKTHLSNQ